MEELHPFTVSVQWLLQVSYSCLYVKGHIRKTLRRGGIMYFFRKSLYGGNLIHIVFDGSFTAAG